MREPWCGDAGENRSLGEYRPVPNAEPGEKNTVVSVLGEGAAPPALQREGTYSLEGAVVGSTCREWVGLVFVKGTCFQSFIALIILMNAVCIGFETDCPEKNWLWDKFEDAFLAIFTVELCLRLYYHRLKFFCGVGQLANIFDFALVFSGVADTAMTFLFHGSMGSFSTIVRMCRLLRILRLFRLFKMFKQLYMLASGFADSSVAVFWVSVLCSLCLYVCAIFLTRTLGKVATGKNPEFYNLKFGSVPMSMFTLFEIMADPNLETMKAAMFEDPVMMGFFLVFVVFGSFAMLSILTGVISEGMIEKGNSHKEEMRFAEERKKQAFMHQLRSHFQDSDADGDGLLTYEEFQANITVMREMFEVHGFSYTEEDLNMVFHLVDFDGGGTVELEEFLGGMTSFTANVSDLPLQVLRLQSNVFVHLNKFQSKIDTSIDGFDARFIAADDRLVNIEQKIRTLASLVQGRR